MSSASNSPSRSSLGSGRSKRSSSASLPSVIAQEPPRYDPYGARGGKSLSATKHPTPLELWGKTSVGVPGPGKYDPEPLKNGSKAGKFSDAVPKSELDWLALRASQLPGPGQYSASGASLGQVLVASRSAKFSTGNPKTELDWIALRSKHLPGPGAYDTDLWTIARRTSRAPAPPPAHVSPPDNGFQSLKGRVRKVEALQASLHTDPLLRSPYQSNSRAQLSRLKRDVLARLAAATAPRSPLQNRPSNPNRRLYVRFPTHPSAPLSATSLASNHLRLDHGPAVLLADCGLLMPIIIRTRSG